MKTKRIKRISIFVTPKEERYIKKIASKHKLFILDMVIAAVVMWEEQVK